MILGDDKIHRCVFCRREFSKTDLTDEHVVPFALGGRLKLKQATCESCRESTSKFETKIIKGSFHAFRFAAGIQSRSGKPPATLPIFCVDGVEGERLDIPFDQYPAMLTLPRIRDAALLDNGRINALPVEPWTAVDWEAAERLLHSFDLQSYASTSIDVYAFSRLIAKIAHCWAISEIGPSFSPSLLGIINSDQGDNYRKYIRSRDNPAPALFEKEHKHRIDLSEKKINGITFIVAHLTLFFNLGAPTYEIVVGQKGGNFLHYPELDVEEINFSPEHRVAFYRFDMSRPIEPVSADMPNPPIDVFLRKN